MTQVPVLRKGLPPITQLETALCPTASPAECQDAWQQRALALCLIAPHIDDFCMLTTLADANCCAHSVQH